MPHDDDDVFDILGIGSREDHYSNLLAYAFGCRTAFRTNFLHTFVPFWTSYSDGRWSCYLRRPIATKNLATSAGTGDLWPTKLSPDLVLMEEQFGKAVLIENKIHAEAGAQQHLYTRPEFHRKLQLDFVRSGMSLPPEPEVVCFYLSLDGRECPVGFKDLRHRDLVALFDPADRSTSSNLGRLLDEYCRRVTEHAEWSQQPLQEVALKDFFQPHKLITEEQLFLKLLDRVAT